MVTKMNQYEAMFLLGPLGTSDLEGGLNLCRKVIESHGGQIIVLKKWDERKLTYEIGGQKRGTYVISYFRAETGAIAPMERDVKLSEEILRVLITRADHLNEQEMAAVEPQPIIKEERPPQAADRWSVPPGIMDEKDVRPARAPRREQAPDPAAAKD